MMLQILEIGRLQFLLTDMQIVEPTTPASPLRTPVHDQPCLADERKETIQSSKQLSTENIVIALIKHLPLPLPHGELGRSINQKHGSKIFQNSCISYQFNQSIFNC